jgi:carbon-monoxide dehydrogenase small subunit
MSSVAIVEDEKEYDREDIKKGLAGNMCRCTGYENIIKAVDKVKNKK